MICPRCHNPVDATSEHQYFDFDVMSIRCTKCGLYSIAGSGEWIQFPRSPCSKCSTGTPHADCPCTSAEFQAFERDHRKAVTALDALACKVHERNRKLQLT